MISRFPAYRPLWMLMIFLLASSATAGPVVPGLARKHPLSEVQVGATLIEELRCNACHSRAGQPEPARNAPSLVGIGERIDPDYLRRFLESPTRTHAGSKMPDLLAGETNENRSRIAEALSHYLVAQSKRPFQRVESSPAKDGKALFHAVGCVACHSPRDEADKPILPSGVVSLEHLPGKYHLDSLASFLHEPLVTRPAGRMPDMKLTLAEAKSIASYLIGLTGRSDSPFQVDQAKVDEGQKQFQRLNCASCHQLGDQRPASSALAWDKLDPKRGCLSESPGAAPDYRLEDAQRRAIRAAIEQKGSPASASAELAQLLTRLNCIACHVRDDYGGVAPELNAYFTSSEAELGDEVRIPPPLTLVGAKLQPVALKKVLFDGDGVRPYMNTRMPQFGEANLRLLPDLVSQLDSVKKTDLRLPKTEGRNKEERDFEKEMRAGGRELVGDKGLGCISCHAFNGKAPGKKVVDLNTMPERLKPDWYYQYMLDPGAFRPRAVMPTAWPGGEAVQKQILGGDTNRQLSAIWYYASLGTSAADPPGIRSDETILQATDAPRTYRGRSSVAGFRGIAVGFPEKLNYAFNAETGTLSAIWAGNFIRVNWSGQGSGNFQPASRAVQLAQDVTLLESADEQAAWPLRPTMTKEAPVNPDPLYPKKHGYQFQGYFMDESSVPTFQYRVGDIRVEDRSQVERKDGQPVLVRTLSFQSPKATTLWLRALTGSIENPSPRQYQTRELRLTVPDAPATLRANSADPKSQELILKIAIPQGSSTATVKYEIRN